MDFLREIAIIKTTRQKQSKRTEQKQELKHIFYETKGDYDHGNDNALVRLQV